MIRQEPVHSSSRAHAVVYLEECKMSYIYTLAKVQENHSMYVDTQRYNDLLSMRWLKQLLLLWLMLLMVRAWFSPKKAPFVESRKQFDCNRMSLESLTPSMCTAKLKRHALKQPWHHSDKELWHFVYQEITVKDLMQITFCIQGGAKSYFKPSGWRSIWGHRHVCWCLSHVCLAIIGEAVFCTSLPRLRDPPSRSGHGTGEPTRCLQLAGRSFVKGINSIDFLQTVTLWIHTWRGCDSAREPLFVLFLSSTQCKCSFLHTMT